MKFINKNFIKRKIYKNLPCGIRLKALRFLLPAMNLELDNIIFRTAATPEDYLAAFNLVYKVFVRTGYTKPGPTPFRLAPQHCHPDSRIFVGMCKDSGKIIYSVSIFPDSDKGLPMDMEFREQLDALRSQGRFIVEAGHLAADPEFKMNTMNIPMLGNKILYQYATQYLGADDIVITTHPRHCWVYEDLLLFERIGQISSYSYANDNPAVALRLDLRTMKKRYARAYSGTVRKNNLYHFFCTEKSASIILSDDSFVIEKQLLENIEYLYGFKSQKKQDDTFFQAL